MCVYHLLKDKYKFKKSLIWDLHDGLMVKNLPCNAWDKGLIPGWGRSHMPTKPMNHTQLLSLRAETTEAQAPQQRGATTVRSPLVTTRESLGIARKIQPRQK